MSSRQYWDAPNVPREVGDLSDPYWKVVYHDGDWEEPTHRELVHGIDVATQPVVGWGLG